MAAFKFPLESKVSDILSISGRFIYDKSQSNIYYTTCSHPPTIIDLKEHFIAQIQMRKFQEEFEKKRNFRR